jgi:hypothetical protein
MAAAPINSEERCALSTYEIRGSPTLRFDVPVLQKVPREA